MATGGQEQLFDSYSCQMCKNVDTMDMVQCDTCDKWFHYDCVGVTDGVANREWSCKCCIQLLEAIQDLEKCQGNPKTPGAFSYVSSKASTRMTMTARQKAVALDRLDEEQAIKLDILDRKYRILEFSESEKDEASRDYGKSSMDYTLHWAKEVRNNSKGLAKMSFGDNVSISLSDREREIVNKHSGQELRKNITYKSAESRQRGSENILKRSVLMPEADGQQQQPSHLKATNDQSKLKIEPEAECGEGNKCGDLEDIFRQHRSVYGKFVQVGNEFKAGAVPKIQRQIIPEDQQTHNPKKVLEPREWEVTPVNGPKTSEIFDWEIFNSQDRQQPQSKQSRFGSSSVRQSESKLDKLGSNSPKLPNFQQSRIYIEPVMHKSSIASCLATRTSDGDYAELDTDARGLVKIDVTEVNQFEESATRPRTQVGLDSLNFNVEQPQQDCTHCGSRLNVQQAQRNKKKNEVQFIHRHAGFELRSFNSNSPEVLKALNDGSQDGAKMLDDKVNFTTERVLGMYWNTEADSFTYCLKFVKCIKFDSHTDKFAPTKREVLSTVMSVFDPLGFLAHFVVYAKILLQEIWRCKVGWDDPLPPILRNKWIQWLDELPKVERVQIPRLYSMRMSPSPPTSIQLHLFVDASLEAFAAVAYFRVENESGVDSCLVEAKTRVAPIKPMSIPRLELQGGVLGTRLAGSIIKSHNDMQIDKTIIWCDSRTVLSWINSDFRKYNQFVSFRVAEILDSDNIEWRWIPSSENVADEATKSKKIAEVEMSTRWYNGPEFLRDSDSNWSFELEQPEYETDEEIRSLYLLAHLEIPIKEFIDFQRFSNWQRLVRTMAYAQRFVYNLRAEFDVRRSGLFSSEELLMAETFFYKKIQYDCFQEELVIVRFNETASVNKQKEFSKTSSIRLCSAYIDDYGVMHMRGRIDAAAISDTVKRPIILSRHHYVTHLVVNFYHQKYKHLHHQTVLNEVKQKFWIPQLRVLLGVIRNNCQKCKNTAAMPKVPEMASLPKARLAVYTRPFTYVGIDYFGPIPVVYGRGTAKRWGVLITCFTTSAVHLEIAYSLDTSSCIMVINNFICLRGQPREFYSDNGTNFHGADNVLRKELEEEFAKLDKDRIQEEFTTSEYSWTFNPPAAPYMGGVWERMVQSVKKCLEKSMTARYPTDEVLKNLFAEAENIVNSRPLTYVSLDSPDDEVLTPNHFLIGSSSGRKPAGDFGDSDLLRNNWRTAQAMADKFWDAFVLEYLSTIMKRTKWTRNEEPVRVDDVVLIVDDNFRRNTWPKGVIVDVFKDKSEQIRSARVRTSLGTFLTRPVSKLVVLNVRRDLINQRQLEVKLRDTGSVNGVENVANRALNSNF